MRLAFNESELAFQREVRDWITANMPPEVAEESRRSLHDRGLVVYLKASAAEIWHRTRRDRSRPLLSTTDPQQRIIDLLAAREPLYAETAHLSRSSRGFDSAGFSPMRSTVCTQSCGERGRARMVLRS